ncbi:hypothetical protein SprV_0200871400 [Sparganum proliferum]
MFTNHKWLASSMSSIRRFKHAHAANPHSAPESVSLDTFALSAPPTQQRLTSPPSFASSSSTLPPVANSAPAATPVTADYPVCALLPPTTYTIRPPLTPVSTAATSTTLPPAAIWTQFIAVPIAIAHSTHTLAWSVTCEYIAWILAD